ncbi:hypothetical protein H2248_009573 [Termitomyces sp. 'cryptogamus']|nr:hypothetical protein H2248_009573 [Termitomyces sp. 'cryptogamus']
MRRQCPFPKTYPQLTVYNIAGYSEYRIENWRLSHDGKGSKVTGTALVSVQDAILVMLNAFIYWRMSPSSSWYGSAQLRRVGTHVCVGSESVIVIPAHGIQLETHRGLPGLRLFASRRFIGLTALQDVVIHEGLRGWDIRFYLVAIKFADSSRFSLEVAYQVSHFTEFENANAAG